MRRLLDDLLGLCGAKRPILWFYTPMMYNFASHVDASAVIYDCMDELANFKFAPPRLKETEAALMFGPMRYSREDIAFTRRSAICIPTFILFHRVSTQAIFRPHG
ncbi:hypothetical protein T190_31120 [Sinorhizobium meliloti CCBAU 01290]|nr:hypothetical protein T190_31120 [Sinorhizobium meliloti CCBAU 01290]